MELSAAVHTVSCRVNRETDKKLSNNAENNTAIASVGSKNLNV